MAVKHPFHRALWALLLLLPAAAPAETLDDFSPIDAWSVTASDGVAAAIAEDRGALRVDIDFESGAGYAVVRREIEMDLAENFDLALDLRAEGLAPNNLELKLIAPETEEGVDVWWVNRRGFAFPRARAWETLHSKRRHFEFAWGPSGGATALTRIAAIEIAVASAEGGAGSVWIDNLAYRALDPLRPYTGTARVSVSSSTSEGWTAWRDAPEGEALGWHAKPGDAAPWIEIDFGQTRVFGGLLLEWAEGAAPGTYRIMASPNALAWQTLASVERGDGGLDAAYLPDTEARYLRIETDAPVPPGGVALESYEVLSVEAAADRNAFAESLASRAPEGWFPEYFSGRQCFWTVVGVPTDSNEALFNENGAIELRRGGPTLEPFIDTEEGLVTWADVETSQSLLEGHLPIPSVTWRTPGGLELETTVVADGIPGYSRLVVRYRLTNTGEEARRGELILALRPFQILPPWQRLNLTGGVSSVSRLAISGNAMGYDGVRGPLALTDPARVMLARFDDADIVRNLHTPAGVASGMGGGSAPALMGGPAVRAPGAARNAVVDPNGLASGAFFFPFGVGAGAHQDVYIEIPLHAESPSFDASGTHPEQIFEERLAANAEAWRALLNRTTISLPPSASRIWDTVRANLAYILINQDGLAIQPGSRTYERSWIRDGALTGTALLSLDHGERVRRYLEWYGMHQFDSGKIPCVVDRRGPDPVDEHDSTGQYIYALWNYGATTGDVGTLERAFPRVLRGVEYIEWLRAQRMAGEYADPGSPKHAMYGLVPESISHEGYSAKPMHSYWDNFFVLRGLSCAAAIAHMIGEEGQAQRLSGLADDFRETLYDSIRLAMDFHGIDYVPGCVELGDYDPTSTAIAIFPGAQLASMPQPETRTTFERYWERVEGRREGTIEWHDYTPYEARIIGAFVLLGWPERARGLMEWLFQDQHPAAWLHWAEVGYRDDDYPGWVGDMPHTWVGAGFINSAIAMLAFHRASDESLVLAAGVDPAWVLEEGGVGVSNLRTIHGPLAYRLAQEGETLTLTLGAGVEAPMGGLVLRVPGERPIASAMVDGAAVPVGPDREIRFGGAPARVEVTFQE